MCRHTALSPSRAGAALQYAALAERLVMMNVANTTHVSTENTCWARTIGAIPTHAITM